MGKRPHDQGSTSRKLSTPTRPATEQTPEIPADARSTPTRSATEQTPEIPADAEATMHDPGNASILRCSDSAVEPDAATEHIAPASFGSADDASSGCCDMSINSLDDVVSKLSSDCDESAAALRNAVQTLQRGVQAEIRNLCNRWGVQLTAKNDNGKYSKRADHILKSELKDTFIAKAKEHWAIGLKDVALLNPKPFFPRLLSPCLRLEVLTLLESWQPSRMKTTYDHLIRHNHIWIEDEHRFSIYSA